MQQEISTAELAKLTQLPRRTLARWASEGVISSTKRGYWAPEATIAAIIRHLRSQSVSMNDKSALLREQVRARRRENDAAERQTVSRSECQEGWTLLCGLMVQVVESLPGRLADRIAHCDTPVEVREILKREVRSIREVMSDELRSLAGKARGE